MATVYKRASVKRALVEDYVYLAEHAGIETAAPFLSSADVLAPGSFNVHCRDYEAFGYTGGTGPFGLDKFT